MTVQERVKQALRHQEPDRVPMDFWSTREMDDKLLSHLSLASREELLTGFGVDFRYYIAGPPTSAHRCKLTLTALPMTSGMYRAAVRPLPATAGSSRTGRWSAVLWPDTGGRRRGDLRTRISHLAVGGKRAGVQELSYLFNSARNLPQKSCQLGCFQVNNPPPQEPVQ